MPRQKSTRGKRSPVETLCVSIVKHWFESESAKGRANVGLANGGLQLIEVFRAHYPLKAEDYTSKGGTQVKGLSGRSGDRIISRFMANAPKLGTEAGRTSRGVFPKVARLAEALNSLEKNLRSVSLGERARLADQMQEWIVNNPIRSYFGRKKLRPALSTASSAVYNVGEILDLARRRSQIGEVSQHLIGAKLALRFPKLDVPNFSYSTADSVTNRPGDFLIGSTVFHVTVSVSRELITKCADNLRDGYRAIILVPEGARVGASQLIMTEGLGDRVSALSIEGFVGQNVEELGDFDQQRASKRFRELLEEYNERVADAEPDPSLQIQIPNRLGKASR